MYEKLLVDFPKKSGLYFEMVELYTGQGNYEKALETIEEIENEFGQSEPLAMTEYRILHIMERPEDAMQALREYNSRYSSPYILCILAEDEMQQYNDSTALAYYDEALGLESSFSPAILGKAEVYRMTHRYEEYFPVLDEYIRCPDATAAEKAEYLLALMEKGDPKFLRVFRPQMDAVIRSFVEVHANDEKVYEVGGMYYFYTGRLDQSRAYFMAYAEACPESYEAEAALVEFLMYTESWEDLSVEGRKAYSRFPEEPTYLEMASVGDYRLGNYEAVLNACEELLTVAADDQKKVNTLSTMGDVYHLLGDTKKAYKTYEAALKIDPENVYVLNNYAYYLSMEGRNLKKAYEMSKKTIEAEPDNATYLDTFGWILYLQGKYIEARPVFKNAMLHGGKESAVILDHYAEVLYALKEYDMAFVYWNLALQKNDGENPDLKAKVDAKRAEIKK
jgi:tetratricopeptide (TPR) repeat protein